MQSEGKTVMVDGRIIWVSGDLFKGRKATEFGTNRPKINKKGEEFNEYGFGLAVPKSACAEVWQAMRAEAMTLFPSGNIPPSFAMKFKDGDTAQDPTGAFYNTREGYAGHIVLACTTVIQPKFFRHENGQNIMINEGIKCGDYVRVQLSIKAHPAVGQGKAGLYMNPMAVLFLGYGKEIVNAPSGDQIFGTTAPPVMGSATPIGPVTQQLVPTMQMPGMSTAQAPTAQPQAMPQPHYGVLPQAHQPVPQTLAQHYPPQVQQNLQQAQPVMPAMPGFPPLPGQG